MATNKEVFVKKESNSGVITASSLYVIDAQEQAAKSEYLPFNKLRMFNTSSVQIYVYLDNYGDGLTPDYILGAGTGIDEGYLEGVQYNVIIIKNNGAVDITANQIKTRLSTVREVL
jgi:hypothetical protein